MSDSGPKNTRRTVLQATLAPIAMAGGCALPRSEATPVEVERLDADLRAYIDFGAKNAGDAGDDRSGAWIESRLQALGYAPNRQPVAALAIEASNPRLILGGAQAPVLVHRTGPSGAFDIREGGLSVWGAGAPAGANPGDIVVAHLPRQRWSSERQGEIRALTQRAFEARAGALVLVTHGPSGEALALNRTLESAAHGPIALLAPSHWPALAAANAQRARLELRARETPRSAFNVIGRLDRGAARWLVVSTPRSGWGVCAGERGPGVALFLALAAWLPRISADNLLFVSASSHEFENAGAEAFLEDGAPAPQQTSLWLHLGAGIAARDWHEAGQRLLPLPSADPQRFLMASPALVEVSQRAFAGISGLEMAYSTEEGASGELATIVAAGYPRLAGIFGAHRYHHAAGDGLRCVRPEHTAVVLERLKAALTLWLNQA